MNYLQHRIDEINKQMIVQESCLNMFPWGLPAYATSNYSFWNQIVMKGN